MKRTDDGTKEASRKVQKRNQGKSNQKRREEPKKLPTINHPSDKRRIGTKEVTDGKLKRTATGQMGPAEP